MVRSIIPQKLFFARVYSFYITRNAPSQKVGGTSTTPSSEFNVALPFIDNEWKRYITLFISHCFCGVKKSYQQFCAMSPCTNVVLGLSLADYQIAWHYTLVTMPTTKQKQRRPSRLIPTSKRNAVNSTPGWKWNAPLFVMKWEVTASL